MQVQRRKSHRKVLGLLLLAGWGWGAGVAWGVEPCHIQIVDQADGWPVPLVELRTTHQVRLVSDNAGNIACDLPELMGQESWFEIIGQGYGVPQDGFGYRGVRLVPEPGKTLRVEVERHIIARRVGRLTGGGIFAESQKLGLHRDWSESREVGCDSVHCAPWQGGLFWLWGDTTLARYPLGVFHTTGARTTTTPFAAQPPLKCRYRYFRAPDGIPRAIAQLPGSGPTWLSGLVSLRAQDGSLQLGAVYVKIKPPLEAYESGLCHWNHTRECFEVLKVIWQKDEKQPRPPRMPDGHPVTWRDDAGEEWLLCGDPFPRLKCPATFEAWQDPTTWAVLQPPRRLQAASGDQMIEPHTGGIAWNAYRQRWVTIFMQNFGTPSVFGEIWYAEAPQPLGPWGRAVKVLSHDNYTFYNPIIHYLAQASQDPYLLFEGTYTMQFTDQKRPTPRYDYTQILYRLDLDDPRLIPARNE